MRYSSVQLASYLLTLFFSVNTFATDVLVGTRSIALINSDGEPYEIANILFVQQSDRITYKIELDESKFSDEFLSMRPFKCIREVKMMVCHLVYPYEKKGYITPDDLTDLEYDLLFLHKSAGEYGINAWNGLYYTLQMESDKISGQLHEVDLNILASPPEAGDIRPVTSDMLYAADPVHHMYPKLTIR